MLPSEAPPKAGKGFAKSMLKLLNSWRDFFIMSRIVSIDVRTARDSTERLGAEIKPTKSGTLVKLVVGGGGGEGLLFTFLLSVNVGSAPTGIDGLSVFIHDGYVNGILPDGMGADDFTLTIPDIGGEVWIEITYDTDTFEITDITFVAGDMPDSEFGILRIRLGYVVTTIDGGIATIVKIVNTQCGDINLSVHYTNINGVLCVEPFQTFGPPIVVP